MQREIKTFQIVRGFAAILVVTNHLMGQAFGGYFSMSGGFGVDMFFVLSGFLMTYTQHDKRGPLKFILGRINRIFPLYIIVSLPLILTVLKPLSFSAVFMNIFLLPTIGGVDYHMANIPSWTLVYEMIFYYVFTLALIFSTNKYKSAIIVCGAILSSIIIARFFDSQPRLWWVNLPYIAGDTLMLNFATGCVLGCLHQFYGSRIRLDLVVFLICFIALTALSHYLFWYLKQPRLISFGIPSVVVIFLASITTQGDGVLFKAFERLGDASYSIYLSHYYLVVLLEKVFIPSIPDLNKLRVISIIMACIAVIIGMLIHRLIEVPLLGKTKRYLVTRQRL